MTTDSKASDVTLLPCPFCGTSEPFVMRPTAKESDSYNPADRLYPTVRCRGCFADMGGLNGDYSCVSAIEKWNARASQQPSAQWIAVMQECREYVDDMIGMFGPCDHDVGLCVCGDKSLLASIDEVLPQSPDTERKEG